MNDIVTLSRIKNVYFKRRYVSQKCFYAKKSLSFLGKKLFLSVVYVLVMQESALEEKQLIY